MLNNFFQILCSRIFTSNQWKITSYGLCLHHSQSFFSRWQNKNLSLIIIIDQLPLINSINMNKSLIPLRKFHINDRTNMKETIVGLLNRIYYQITTFAIAPTTNHYHIIFSIQIKNCQICPPPHH